MERREWRGAVWLWGIVAMLVSADVYTNVAGGVDVRTWSGQYAKAAAAEGVSRGSAGEELHREKDVHQAQQMDAAPDDWEILYERKEIALTFDDGPHPEYTVKLLDGLKERDVRASFFLIGQNIDGNEEILRRMQEEGHLIGNHSQNHMQLTKGDAELACQQITSTNQQIYEVTGQMPTYVRPPFGSWSEELECIVPMTVALWDIDPMDWKTQNTDKIVNHVVKKAEDGGIILLHDVYETSVDAALEIVDRLSEKGYNFVTVDELLIE